MSCPEITGLTFSSSGIKAIEEIRRIQGFGKGLTILMGSSVLVSIFVGMHGVEKPGFVAWNIRQTEWGAWSQAMVSINPIVRAQIKKTASDEAFNHSSGKEYEFWKAVADGCSY